MTITQEDGSGFTCRTMLVGFGSIPLVMDYGNGACDQFATLTLPNGSAKQVKAGKWW